MPNLELAAERAARKWKIDPRIFKAMIRQESNFNPHAKSGAGAEGIAQFMPDTAAGYGVNLHDNRVTDDLEGAAHYLHDNLQKTGGNYHQALSIYNSGKPDAYRDPGFAKGQTYNYVRTILGNAKGESLSGGASLPSRQTGASSVPGQGTGTTSVTEATHSFDAPGYEKARGLAILGQHLLKTRGPNNPLLKSGLVTTQAPDISQFEHTDLTTLTGPKLSQGIQARGYSGTTADLIARANQVDAHHLPYSWGGGHAGKTDPSQGVPVDCSGAVSEVLGIDPRVASQFKSFGKPGRGRVTIYAKDTHVLMEINGHFFGTSASNPGGGAGWIPRSAISPQYLKGFTARHIDA